MIKLYIANLGKYNEGDLVGKWIELPCSEGELNQLFVEIGVGYYDKDVDGEYVHGLEVDGTCYEEYAIHDFECDIEGLDIGEYDSITRLNELAEAYDNLQEYEQKTVSAIIEWKYYCNDDVMNAIENVGDFRLMEEVTNDQEYGDYIIENGLMGEIPENLAMYIDTEAIGRDWVINNECFYSSNGLIEKC